jgi:hypothetical protein
MALNCLRPPACGVPGASPLPCPAAARCRAPPSSAPAAPAPPPRKGAAPGAGPPRLQSLPLCCPIPHGSHASRRPACPHPCSLHRAQCRQHPPPVRASRCRAAPRARRGRIPGPPPRAPPARAAPRPPPHPMPRAAPAGAPMSPPRPAALPPPAPRPGLHCSHSAVRGRGRCRHRRGRRSQRGGMVNFLASSWRREAPRCQSGAPEVSLPQSSTRARRAPRREGAAGRGRRRKAQERPGVPPLAEGARKLGVSGAPRSGTRRDAAARASKRCVDTPARPSSNPAASHTLPSPPRARDSGAPAASRAWRACRAASRPPNSGARLQGAIGASPGGGGGRSARRRAGAAQAAWRGARAPRARRCRWLRCCCASRRAAAVRSRSRCTRRASSASPTTWSRSTLT